MSEFMLQVRLWVLAEMRGLIFQYENGTVQWHRIGLGSDID